MENALEDLEDLGSISQEIVQWKKNLELKQEEDKNEITHLVNLKTKSFSICPQPDTKCVTTQTDFFISEPRNRPLRKTMVPQPKRSTYYGSPDRTYSPDSIQTLKEFECNYCGKSYKKESNLGDHVDYIHLRIFKYKCSFEGCSSTFLNNQVLSRHTKNEHAANSECAKLRLETNV